MLSRSRILLVAFLATASLWAWLEQRDWAIPLARTIDLPRAALAAERGHAYTTPLPAELGDARSRLLEGTEKARAPLAFLEACWDGRGSTTC